MVAFTPDARNHAGLSPQDSRFVRTAELPWETAIFPGVSSRR